MSHGINKPIHATQQVQFYINNLGYGYSIINTDIDGKTGFNSDFDNSYANGSSFFLQYNDEYPRDNSQEMYKLTFQWKEITINN